MGLGTDQAERAEYHAADDAVRDAIATREQATVDFVKAQRALQQALRTVAINHAWRRRALINCNRLGITP